MASVMTPDGIELWCRIYREQTERGMDADRAIALADAALDGVATPWTAGALAHALGQHPSIPRNGRRRLCRCGSCKLGYRLLGRVIDTLYPPMEIGR